MKITLPPMPFDVPPKPKELTAAPSARLLKVRRVDVSLLGEESGEYREPLDGEEVPMGKRKDWVIPEPNRA